MMVRLIRVEEINSDISDELREKGTWKLEAFMDGGGRKCEVGPIF